MFSNRQFFYKSHYFTKRPFRSYWLFITGLSSLAIRRLVTCSSIYCHNLSINLDAAVHCQWCAIQASSHIYSALVLIKIRRNNFFINLNSQNMAESQPTFRLKLTKLWSKLNNWLLHLGFQTCHLNNKNFSLHHC